MRFEVFTASVKMTVSIEQFTRLTIVQDSRLYCETAVFVVQADGPHWVEAGSSTKVERVLLG